MEWTPEILEWYGSSTRYRSGKHLEQIVVEAWFCAKVVPHNLVALSSNGDYYKSSRTTVQNPLEYFVVQNVSVVIWRIFSS